MNSNKKLVGLRTLLFVIAALGVALFGLSSVAWGQVTIAVVGDEFSTATANVACLTLGGPYSGVDLTKPAVVANGQVLTITITAITNFDTGEMIDITLPSNLEWTGTPDVTWWTEVGSSSVPDIDIIAPGQILRLEATGACGAAGTIQMDILQVRAISGVTSPQIAAQVNLVAGPTPPTGGIGTADCGEITIVAGPAVTFTDPVAGADTTKSTVSGTAQGYSGLGYDTAAGYVYSDTYGEATFDLWISTDSSLVDVTEGATPALDIDDVPITGITEAGTGVSIYTRGLQEGTYYVYATSDHTGDIKVGRSDGLVLTHRPYASLVSPAVDSTLDSGGLYNVNGVTLDGSGVYTAYIYFTVVDYDDNAAVRLYYGPSGLDESHVITSGSAGDTTLAVDSLRTATLVAYSDTLCENEDTFINWSICLSDTEYVTADEYKMYAVACDGKHYDVRSSGDFEFYVKHSPKITLDDVPAAVTTSTERYVTIAWGQGLGLEGDKDIDNPATINLYYSEKTDWAVGEADLLIADITAGLQNTHLITTSGIAENPDGRTDDQYVWDLWTYRHTDLAVDADGIPDDGQAYRIYAIISDGASSYLDQCSADITFTHDSWARLKNPVDTGSTVNEGESYRFTWEDVELDADCYIQIILVPDVNYDALTPAEQAALTLFGGAGGLNVLDTDGHIATSTAGTWVTGIGPEENDEDDYFEFKPELLTGIAPAVGGAPSGTFGDDTYYVFLCVSSAVDAQTTPNVGDPIFLAPGTLTVSGTGGAPVAYGLEMTPTDVVAAAGDTVTFSIYPNANSQTVKTAYVYISADTTYWTVVDQVAGGSTQPFLLNATDYAGGSELENDTHDDDVSDGLHHLDFTYSDNTVEFETESDGDQVLATFQLVSRGVSGANEADTYVKFDQVPGRETAFYDGVDQKVCSVPMPAAMAKVMRRGTIAGRVPLQGRESDYSKEVTFSLRKKGSFEPITDAAYVDSNDTNSGVPGVQMTTGVDGSFQLIEVPSGVYTLVVHTDGYLDGQKQTISVDPGDHLTGQDPTYNATPTDLEKLLGGDCAGYTDTTGATGPDNQVQLADENAVNNAFDLYVTDPSDTNYVKDIDGDGHIYTADLNMVTANTGKDGVAPVYKPVPGDNEGASFSVVIPERVEVGEVFDVVVRSEQIADVRAYAVRVQYDGLRLMGVTEGPFLRNAAPAAFVTLDRGREVVIASAIRGRTRSARADDEVAVLRFESRKSGAPVVRLSEAEVFDSADRRTAMRFAAQTPERFAVSKAFPNPFNPTVTLSIQLVEETEVSMNIFDVLGRKVATVEAGHMPAGAHVLSWDGRNDAGRAVASGLYFFAVDAGTVREVRKAALLR